MHHWVFSPFYRGADQYPHRYPLSSPVSYCPSGRDQQVFRVMEMSYTHLFVDVFFGGGSSSDSSSAFESSLLASVVTVRLRTFKALLTNHQIRAQVNWCTYAARVGRARLAGGESDTLEPATSSLSSSESPRFRLRDR
jgi:hypothetical protein